MGVKNILRVHDSIGKCFENDLCKLCGCNFWRHTYADEMRLKQQLAFFYANCSTRSKKSGQGKGASTMSQPWGVVSCSHLL